ncbi:hypothetical protein CP533_4920 [Ophiocordyceps camponoti-saundersi (nom. inval.)]|nr:hypothetical protein CP533_4920 [Ophiocordyceps camponoti-saundersi (nom. inval.)]
MRFASLLVLAILPGNLGFLASIGRFLARIGPSFRSSAISRTPARLSVGRGNFYAHPPNPGSFQNIGQQQSKFAGFSDLSGKLTDLPSAGRSSYGQGYDPNAMHPANLGHPPNIGWKVSPNAPPTMHANSPSNLHDIGLVSSSHQMHAPGAYQAQGYAPGSGYPIGSQQASQGHQFAAKQGQLGQLPASSAPTDPHGYPANPGLTGSRGPVAGNLGPLDHNGHPLHPGGAGQLGYPVGSPNVLGQTGSPAQAAGMPNSENPGFWKSIGSSASQGFGGNLGFGVSNLVTGGMGYAIGAAMSGKSKPDDAAVAASLANPAMAAAPGMQGHPGSRVTQEPQLIQQLPGTQAILEWQATRATQDIQDIPDLQGIQGIQATQKSPEPQQVYHQIYSKRRGLDDDATAGTPASAEFSSLDVNMSDSDMGVKAESHARNSSSGVSSGHSSRKSTKDSGSITSLGHVRYLNSTHGVSNTPQADSSPTTSPEEPAAETGGAEPLDFSMKSTFVKVLDVASVLAETASSRRERDSESTTGLKDVQEVEAKGGASNSRVADDMSSPSSQGRFDREAADHSLGPDSSSESRPEDPHDLPWTATRPSEEDSHCKRRGWYDEHGRFLAVEEDTLNWKTSEGLSFSWSAPVVEACRWEGSPPFCGTADEYTGAVVHGWKLVIGDRVRHRAICRKHFSRYYSGQDCCQKFDAQNKCRRGYRRLWCKTRS